MRELLFNRKVKETISEMGTLIICTGSITVFFAEIFKWLTTF